MENNNYKWLGFGLILILVIAIFEQQRRKQQAVKAAVSETGKNIATGNVGGTLGGVVSDVPRDTNYNPDYDAKAIWNAGCWQDYFGNCWGGGDQAKVVSIISRLNKSQLATLYDYFKKTYGKTLDEFIAKYFYESERRAIQQTIASVR